MHSVAHRNIPHTFFAMFLIIKDTGGCKFTLH